MQTIHAAIIGAAGYTGGELIRLLIHHPQVEIAFAHSSSNAYKPVSDVHQDIVGETNLVFTNTLPTANEWNAIDLLFLCSGHGEAKKFLSNHAVPADVKIIDVGNDFRLSTDAIFNDRTFVYGLPELQKEKIIVANNIANPGCFATAIQLGLLPLAKAGLLTQVYTTGITGSTGAGQGLSATSHFSWRANNIQAYKTLTHQHLGEIHQSIHQLQNTTKANVHFVPWRGDFTRGIFVSSTLHTTLSLPELNVLYTNFYAQHPFTHLVQQPLHLKQVVNTNKCCIYIEQTETATVIHSAIDNLLKGAVGQAVQNMNLLFGFAETCGLGLKGSGF
jgi:N-acetyl-gamma-glutamyl-phosphate reductase